MLALQPCVMQFAHPSRLQNCICLSTLTKLHLGSKFTALRGIVRCSCELGLPDRLYNYAAGNMHVRSVLLLSTPVPSKDTSKGPKGIKGHQKAPKGIKGQERALFKETGFVTPHYCPDMTTHHVCPLQSQG